MCVGKKYGISIKLLCGICVELQGCKELSMCILDDRHVMAAVANTGIYIYICKKTALHVMTLYGKAFNALRV